MAYGPDPYVVACSTCLRRTGVLPISYASLCLFLRYFDCKLLFNVTFGTLSTLLLIFSFRPESTPVGSFTEKETGHRPTPRGSPIHRRSIVEWRDVKRREVSPRERLGKTKRVGRLRKFYKKKKNLMALDLKGQKEPS